MKLPGWIKEPKGPMTTRSLSSVAMLICAVSAAAVLIACFAPSAQAAVRSGSATFAAPAYNSPSLEPRPPASQTVNAPGVASISYDDAGAITVSYRNYDAAFFADSMPETEFTLYEDCDYRGDGELSVTMQYHKPDPQWEDDDPPGRIAAERVGFNGAATGTVTFDGATFTGSITNAGLAGLDLRCAFVSVGVLDYETNVRIPGKLIHFDNVPAPPPKPDPRKIADTKPTYLLAGPYHYSERTHMQVRPRRFGLWGDSMAESGHYLKMRWSKWGRSVAIGRGKAVALHGERKHGRLVFSKTQMRLKLSRPVLCGRAWVFTRITHKSKYGTFRRAIPNGCWN